jgi:ABC-type Fe3+ transport system permease subunit
MVGGRWMAFPFAVGVSMFECFAGAVWVFQQRSPRARQRFGRSVTTSLLAAVAAGLVSGVLAFLFSRQ